MIEFEARESGNSLVGWSSLQFSKSMLKSPRRKLSLEILTSSYLIRELKSYISISRYL